ncbi:hypothetical protein D3248_05750 [Leucobacter zeae]|nr:hypothetical protein [Leucobacter zeae]
MELTHFLRYALALIPMPIIETPIIIGLVLFSLSWLRRNPWVSLPRDARRRSVLAGVGFWGAIAIAAVAGTVGCIAAFSGYEPSGVAGWWRRPAPMAAAALVIGIAAMLLARHPLPAPGERAISPRRSATAFAPKGRLWLLLGAAALLGITSVWQGCTTSLLPNGAQMVGRPTENGGTLITAVPDTDRVLPVGPFVDTPAGGGWLNNGVTLAVLVVLIAVLLLALSGDANRPIHARTSAPGITEDRQRTAKLFVLLALGGVLITLGMLWMYVGYLGGWSVTLEATNENASGLPSDEVGFVSLAPSFAAFASSLRFGGWFLQGVGFALLLRIAVDARRSNRHESRREEASGAAETGRTEDALVEAETTR